MPPRKSGGPAAFLRGVIATWFSSGGAAGVSPDFAAATAVTVMGNTAGLPVAYHTEVEKLRLIVGGADFAGASGTLTFVLRKNGAAGAALATLVVPLASALRGAVIEAAVAAVDDATAILRPGDTLFVTRTATGTAFTTGEGTFQIIGRQVAQSKGV